MGKFLAAYCTISFLWWAGYITIAQGQVLVESQDDVGDVRVRTKHKTGESLSLVLCACVCALSTVDSTVCVQNRQNICIIILF